MALDEELSRQRAAAAEQAGRDRRQGDANQRTRVLCEHLIREFLPHSRTLAVPLPVGGWRRLNSGSHKWKYLGVDGWSLADVAVPDSGTVAVLTDGRAIRHSGTLVGTGRWGEWRGLSGTGIQVHAPLDWNDNPLPGDRVTVVDWADFPKRDEKGVPVIDNSAGYGGTLETILARWVLQHGG